MKRQISSLSALIALSTATASAGIVASPFANEEVALTNGFSLDIDMNGDSTNDFTLYYNNAGGSIIGETGNEIFVLDDVDFNARPFVTGEEIVSSATNNGTAYWNNLISNGFSCIGVKFQTGGGQTNLGWIQLFLPDSTNGYLVRGAWESVAGQGIQAGGIAVSITPSNGPFAGGNNALIANCAPLIGNGSDITNVAIGGLNATNIIGQGTNWVRFVVPPAVSAGRKDITIQSASAGGSVLSGAYTVCATASNLPLGTVVYDDSWTWSGAVLGWRVAHTNYTGATNSVTLWSTNSIGSMPFHAPGWNNRWIDATLRSYLNTGFYANFSPAFTSIVEQTIVPWAIWNPTAPPASGITTDHVFIASMTELGGTALSGDGTILGWFSDTNAAARRMAIGSWFWTRTGEHAEYGGAWYDMSAYYVRSDTGAFVGGNWTYDNMGVIPMLNIMGSAQFEPMTNGTFRLASPMAQTISFPEIAAQKQGNSVGLAAMASSGLPVSFMVTNGPGAISGGTNLTFTALGDVAVVASQAGYSYWQAAPSVTNIVHVYDPEMAVLGTNGTVIASGEAASAAKGTDFGSIPWCDSLVNTFVVTNSGSVELNISEITINGDDASVFSITPLVSGIPSGGVSNFSIQFAPLAAETYTAAVHVVNDSTTTPYIVYLNGTGSRQEQAALDFNPESPQTYNTTNALSASGGSGTGELGYAVASGPGQVVNSTNLLATCGTGMVTVVATKAEDALYNSIASTALVATAHADQTITFPAISDQIVTSVVHLAATSSSGLPLSFSVGSGPGTIINNTNLRFTATGTVGIVASQAGNTNYNAAPNVTNIFNVLPAPIQDGWLTINVAPETGSWQLTASPGYTGPTSGTGTLSAVSAVTGQYSISYGALSGYVAPTNQTKFVTAGSTTFFAAVYLQISTNISSPAGVSATEGTYTNKIRVAWNGATGAIGYEIWRSGTNDSSTAVMIADIPLVSLHAGPLLAKAAPSLDGGERARALQGKFSLQPLALSLSYYYDDYSINPVFSYYYWVRAKTSSLISPMSYVGMGYAALSPDQKTETADIGASDFVFLPVNITNSSHPGTMSCWIQNYGPDNLASSAVRMDFYMTNASATAWIGSAQTNLTLNAGEEKAIIISRTDKQGIIIRDDLSGVQTAKVTVRHSSGLYDPNTANNTCPAAGMVLVKTNGVNSTGRSFNDYDGDGKADGALCATNMLVWAVVCSSTRYHDIVVVETGETQWNAAPGDYEGCGQTGVGVYVPSLGYWYVWFPAGGEGHSFFLGGPDYTAAPCDFDGDGKTDPVVYHNADGCWYGLSSSESYAMKYAPGAWQGYTPVPGDYDGDGKADPAAYYNGRTGMWIIGPSSMGYSMLTGVFGGPGWLTASADYDGDGKTDPAVYAPAAAYWQVLLSGSLDATGQYTWWGGFAGSINGIPVPADYDGDGKADLAIYHSDTGIWQIFLSTQNYLEFSGGFGGPEYQPVRE